MARSANRKDTLTLFGGFSLLTGRSRSRCVLALAFRHIDQAVNADGQAEVVWWTR
ncbi:hypothetical protein M3J09_002144 [Ascochyta lentis]